MAFTDNNPLRAGTAGYGGEWVSKNYVDSIFAPAVNKKALLTAFLAAGGQIILKDANTGISSYYPVVKTRPTAYGVSTEGGAKTPSSFQTDEVIVTLQEFYVDVPVSKKFLLTANRASKQMLLAQCANAIADKLDSQFLAGNTDPIKGIINSLPQTLVSGALDLGDLDDAFGLLDNYNYAPTHIITTPQLKSYFRALKENNNRVFPVTASREIAVYETPIISTANLSGGLGGKIIVGDFSKLAIEILAVGLDQETQFAGFNVLEDPYSDRASNGYWVRVETLVGFAVLDPKAFVVIGS